MAILKALYYTVLFIGLFALLTNPVISAFLLGAYLMLRLFAGAARQAFERCCSMLLMLLIGIVAALFVPRFLAVIQRM